MTEARARRGRPPGADGGQTRQRILRGARTVFSDTGFDRATMDQIARAAGITRNAIANYYSGKEELHRAAARSVQQEAFAEIMSRLPGPDRPAVERISALFRTAVGFHEEDRTFVRFWVTSILDAARHAELEGQSQRHSTEVHRYFTDCLVLGVERGELRAETPADRLAQLLVDLLWGVAMDLGFHSQAEQVQRTLAPLDLLLRGVCARD